MGRGSGSHVAGKQGDIRITFADLLHLFQHAQAVPVGRVNIDHVHLRVQQCVDPLKNVVGYAYRGAAQEPAFGILGAVGILACLLNILDGNQAAQVEVLIHDRKFFNPVGGQDFLGLFQGCAFRGCYQVFAGHYLADGAVVIRFKPEVTVGQDAYEFAVPGNRDSADPVAAHQFFSVGNQVFGAQEKGVGNDAVLTALHLIHLGSLFFNGHVFMNDSQSAFPGHGDGHPAVSHGIHGGAQYGNIQLDVLCQLD